MTSFTASDRLVLEPGVYAATFIRTEESVEEGPYGHFIDWYFSVETDDGDVQISGRSSRPERLTRSTKARVWLEELLGRPLAKSESVDTRSLEGTRVRLTVGVNDSGEFNRVTAVRRQPEAGTGKADDLPF
jgi:hypothetical protein